MALKFNNENLRISYSIPNFKQAIDMISEQFTKHYREVFARAKKNIDEAVIEAKEIIYSMLPTIIDAEEYQEEKRRQIAEELFYDVIGLGPIHELYHQKDKTDMFIDGPYEVYYKNTKNEIIETNIRFRDEEHLLFILDKLLDPIGESLDKSHLSVECTLKDGTRFSALHHLVSAIGTMVSFRFHNKTVFTPEELIACKTINAQMAWFYKIAAQVGWNMIFFGDTGSGKTSSAASIITMHNEKQRIAIISDILEMNIKQKCPHLKALEIYERKRGNSIFTTYDALLKSLRHQIDRIYFNEIRGAEFLTLLDAWATGHPGGAGTHAENFDTAWSRMIIMLKRGDNSLTDETCSRMISSTVDILVECKEYGENRIHATVNQLIGNEGMKPITSTLFEFDYDKQMHTSNIQNIDEKLLKKCKKSNVDFFEEARKSGLFPKIE